MPAGRPRKSPGRAQGHGAAKPVVIQRDAATPAPKPPAELSKWSQERWHALWRSDVAGLIDEVDRPRLERWITALDEWHHSSREFRKERLVPGSRGQLVLNPLAAHIKSLEDTVAKAEAEFGLTPRSRAQLGITFGQAVITAADVNKLGEDNRRDVLPGALADGYEEG